MTNKTLPIRQLRGSIVAENRFVRVRLDDIEFNNKQSGTHFVIEEPSGGAVVVVRNQAQQYYLHEAFHYAAQRWFSEFIRGYAESNELLAAAAIRELAEEAGFAYSVTEAPQCIGYVFANATLLSNRVPVFMVCVESGDSTIPAEQNEGLRNGRFVNMQQLLGMIASGEIEDGFTLSAVSMILASDS